jgi:hypothetical protein
MTSGKTRPQNIMEIIASLIAGDIPRLISFLTLKFLALKLVFHTG